MAIPIFFHIFALLKRKKQMGRLLFFMFTTLIMALIFMAVSDFLSRKGNKTSKKENRETFEKDIDDLANKIKNKQ